VLIVCITEPHAVLLSRRYAAAFLIPVGVMLYTAHGGLKATFIAAWGHVAVIYIALCIFAFLIYAAPSSATPLGSISKVRCLDPHTACTLFRHRLPDTLPQFGVLQYSCGTGPTCPGTRANTIAATEATK